MNFSVKTDTGSFDIEADVRFIGPDLLVAVWGGEQPHIGAVSAAHPRPSLKNRKVLSATSSVLCYTGHKEDDLAKAMSEILAASLNTRVVVTAGIHWDNLPAAGIKMVFKNAELLTDRILGEIVSRKK